MQGDAAVDPRRPYPDITACTTGSGPDSNASPLAIATWDPQQAAHQDVDALSATVHAQTVSRFVPSHE